MGKYNFDALINRVGTGSLKYDYAVKRGRPEGILPLWVADMDLPIAKEIEEALIARSHHPVFGYSEPMEDYFEAVSAWYERNFAWQVKEEWLTKTPGVVFALAMAVRAYTKPGEAVLIQQPVYYPFTEVIEDNDRRVISSDLILENGKYITDYKDLEQKIVDNHIKLMLLCSPHNPVGRVWTADELRQLGDICLKHEVIVVSDEIHADFVWEGNKHTPFAKLGEAYAQNSVICTAPSKTFNIAGLQISNIFIPNKELRRAFRREVNAAGYSQCNTMGLVACVAAYKYGQQWADEARAYIYDNILFLERYLEENVPQIKLIKPEGTYLVWLDFGSLPFEDAGERELWLWHKANLWLDSGAIFGKLAADYERINVACPRATLLKALEQLKAAIAVL